MSNIAHQHMRFNVDWIKLQIGIEPSAPRMYVSGVCKGAMEAKDPEMLENIFLSHTAIMQYARALRAAICNFKIQSLSKPI